MHFETIADTGMKKLVVGRTGSLAVVALASYGAVTLVQDTVTTTKGFLARRKAAKETEKPQDPTA